MSDKSKHSVCALLSACFVIVGLLVLIEISTGVFGMTFPLEPTHEALSAVAKTIATALWSLRYIVIVLMSFALALAPWAFPGFFILMPVAVVVTASGNMITHLRVPGQLPSVSDHLNIVGLPIATAIISLVTAYLIRRSLRCAHKAGWIG